MRARRASSAVTRMALTAGMRTLAGPARAAVA